MKKVHFSVFTVVVLSLALMCIFSCAPKQSMSDSPAAGGQVSEVGNMDVAGLMEYLEQNKGKVIIVDIWATWCPPCRAEIPDFIDLYAEYKDKGLQMVGLSVDQFSSEVKLFSEKMGINYPLYMAAKDISEEFNVRGIPTTLIYDKESKLYKKHIGYASKEFFEDIIKELLEK